MNDEAPHRIPWIAIILALLAVLALFNASDGRFNRGIVPMMGGYGGDYVLYSETDATYPTSAPMPPAISPRGMMGGISANMSARMISPEYPGYWKSQPSASDAREFLKVSYGAEMQTRDVPALTRRVESTVRGADGRVDNTTSSREYGYVSFVVPMSKYEGLRDELETLVGSRFLTVNISSENLLPQKVSIEEQQKYVETNISDLKDERASLVSSHSRAVVSIQSQLNANTQEIASLNSEATSDPVRRAQITARLQVLYNEQSVLKSRLAGENSSYADELEYIDYELKYEEKSLEAVKSQDQDLLDSVATVNGSVSINWIGLYDIAELYLPGYWIPALLAALATIAYYLNRRRVWIF
ncbi:MAG TPA: hypothetical protein VJH91_02445 [Candidatus Paceibacterota bacterium]